MRLSHGLIALLLLQAACADTGPAPDLPTLAALPTATDTLAPPRPLSTASTAASESPEPSATFTPTTIARSPTVTVTPSATITDTPTPTATLTPTATETLLPTPDNEGLLALAQLAANATILPQQPPPAFVQPTALPLLAVSPPPVICAQQPAGGFAVLYAADPLLAQQLGCSLGSPLSEPSASQIFERGDVFWLAGPPSAIFVLTYSTGRFQRYDDTFNSLTDPISGGEVPPPGLLEPVRGFGKVWRSFPEVRGNLGWALAAESGGQTALQPFERGQMVYLPQRSSIVTLVYDPGVFTSGIWRSNPGSP